jgi:hypothetical protein
VKPRILYWQFPQQKFPKDLECSMLHPQFAKMKCKNCQLELIKFLSSNQ